MVITNPRLPDNPIVFANEAFQHLAGYSGDEIIGRNCRFLQGPDTDREAVSRIRAAVEAEASLNVELLNYRKDGSRFWNALYLSPVKGADGEVQFFFASQLDVTERVDAQRVVTEQRDAVEAEVRARTADLRAALDAKTTLLHEVDHRVKNNLTMIGSLLRLQARGLPDPALRETVDNMLSRVDALASVHKKLYQGEDIGRFDLSGFAVALVGDILEASRRSDVALKICVEPTQIATRNAAAVGLILSEIATNAVRHAFPADHGGAITLTLQRNQRVVNASVSDDGVGMAADPPRPGAIGRSLIQRLSRQVNGETRWTTGPRGTTASLTFADDDGQS
jgi:PAS domain S-box-containing protein